MEEHKVNYLKPLNLIKFGYDITTLAFSPDSNYLAVCAGTGLIIFEAIKHSASLSFEPTFREVAEGPILALQWTASNIISYYQDIPIRDDTPIQIEVRRVPGTKKQRRYPLGASYTFCKQWKLEFCGTNHAREHFDVEGYYVVMGAKCKYFAVSGPRSVQIWDCSSFRPHLGLMKDFGMKLNNELKRGRGKEEEEEEEEGTRPTIKKSKIQEHQSPKREEEAVDGVESLPSGLKTKIQEHQQLKRARKDNKKTEEGGEELLHVVKDSRIKKTQR